MDKKDLNLIEMYNVQYDNVINLLEQNNQQDLNIALDTLKKFYELNQMIVWDQEFGNMDFEIMMQDEDGNMIDLSQISGLPVQEIQEQGIDINKLLDTSLDFYNKVKRQILNDIYKIRTMTDDEVKEYLKSVN